MIKEITINELSIEFKKMFNIDEKSIINPFNKIVAYFDDEIKGFIIYSIIYDRCEIEYIGVSLNSRNNKIATKLIEYMMKDIENKCKNITLEVNENNKAAIALYNKFDFKIAAKRKFYYGNENGILMIKELGD